MNRYFDGDIDPIGKRVKMNRKVHIPFGTDVDLSPYESIKREA